MPNMQAICFPKSDNNSELLIIAENLDLTVESEAKPLQPAASPCKGPGGTVPTKCNASLYKN
jgi:hypothetical protein